MDKYLYHYKAIVTKVYDGDTITVDIDLGLHSWIKKERLRLSEIDTPEIRGKERPEGLIAAEYLRNLLLGQEIIIETIKDKKGKYGRYLARIHLLQEDGSYLNVNIHMVTMGYAEFVTY